MTDWTPEAPAGNGLDTGLGMDFLEDAPETGFETGLDADFAEDASGTGFETGLDADFAEDAPETGFEAGLGAGSAENAPDSGFEAGLEEDSAEDAQENGFEAGFEADSQDPEAASDGQTGQAQAQPEPQELFELPGVQGPRQVTREELTALAQKGESLDWVVQQRDSLRQERDDLVQLQQVSRPALGQLERLASRAGVDVPAYLAALQENTLVAQGMDRAQARQLAQARQAQSRAQMQQAQAQMARQEQERHQAQARIRADLQAFGRQYPQVRLQDVPAQVWQQVDRGESLLSAYSRHAVETLQAENGRLRQQAQLQSRQAENKARSVGSVRSAGAPARRDSFLCGMDLD